MKRLMRLAPGAVTTLMLVGVAAPAHASVPGVRTAIVCSPTLLSRSAFPYTATTGYPPSGCTNTFAWGYTVAGSATGQAEWDSPITGSWSCTAQAWIPDSHSNDPNAQYYLYDGNKYLANDAFVNQNNVTNNWVDISNNTSFQVSDHLRITLSDHNPKGVSGAYIAAYAVKFICSQPGA